MKKRMAEGQGIGLSGESRGIVWAQSARTCQFKLCQIVSCTEGRRNEQWSPKQQTASFAASAEEGQNLTCVIGEITRRNCLPQSVRRDWRVSCQPQRSWRLQLMPSYRSVPLSNGFVASPRVLS